MLGGGSISGCRGDSYAWLLARRQQLTQYVYGAVDFRTLLPAVIERNYSTTSLPSGPLPAGVASVDRYTMTDVGGRGGTGYGWLCHPTAAWNGVLACVHGGHAEFFNQDPISGVVAYLAQQGCTVLAGEMPLAGNNGTTMTLVTSGSPVLYTASFGTYHPFQPLDQDGGPNSTRAFLDMTMASLNQAIVDLSPRFVFYCGHSGGGLTTELMGSLDTRIQASYSIFGSAWWVMGPPQIPYPIGDGYQSGTNDWDTCQLNPLWKNGASMMWRHALPCFPNRRMVKIVADGDSTFGCLGMHTSVLAGQQEIVAMLQGYGSFDVAYDPVATSHMTIDWSHATIWTDVQARMAALGIT